MHIKVVSETLKLLTENLTLAYTMRRKKVFVCLVIQSCESDQEVFH